MKCILLNIKMMLLGNVARTREITYTGHDEMPCRYLQSLSSWPAIFLATIKCRQSAVAKWAAYAVAIKYTIPVFYRLWVSSRRGPGD